MKKIILLLMFAIAFNILNSQEYNLRKIERIIEQSSENESSFDLKDVIDYYYFYKLSLRTSSVAQLAELPTISYHTAMLIKGYIKKNPNFTLSDLCEELNLDEDQEYILTICTRPLSIDILKDDDGFRLSFQSISELPFQENKGLEQGKYLGTNFGLTNKLTASLAGFKAGAVVDKDIGEKGIIDLYGAYAQLPVFNTDLIIGNFRAAAGNGNILSKNFSTSKLISSMQGGNSANSISPSLTTMENQVFTGAAAGRQFEISEGKVLSATAFASLKNLPATLDGSGCVSSIYASGYFRTQNEIDKKSNLKETSFGGILTYSSGAFVLGASAYSIGFDKPVLSSSSSAISGDNELLSSLFASLYFDSLSLSGEFSLNKAGNSAFTLFTKYYRESSEFNLNFRYFSPNFRSPKGTNPGENSFPANEIGLTFTYKNNFSRKLNLIVMLDYFESINRTYYVFQPIKGIESELRLNWKLNRSNEFYLQFAYKNKNDQKTFDKDKLIYTDNKYKLRLEYINTYSKVFEQKFRFDINYLAENDLISEKFGFLAYTDLEINPFENFKTNMQLAYFSTDDYDAAIWLFNYFSSSYTRIYTLYDKGIRANLYARYKFFDSFQIGIGYRYYKKFDKSIGSGYDEIRTGIDNRIMLSLEYILK